MLSTDRVKSLLIQMQERYEARTIGQLLPHIYNTQMYGILTHLQEDMEINSIHELIKDLDNGVITKINPPQTQPK